MDLLHYYGNDKQIQVGLDEAGRGCILGPVVVAAVVWDPNIQNNEYVDMIKDSKKLTKKKRLELKEFIEHNVIDFNVCYSYNDTIDSENILKCTLNTMHDVLDGIKAKYDMILVDGDKFNSYKNKDHVCIIGGDNKYKSIAAASILAKTYHDYWIDCLEDELLDTYDLRNNMGYGTKSHINAIKLHGLSKYHRKTFCKKLIF